MTIKQIEEHIKTYTVSDLSNKLKEFGIYKLFTYRNPTLNKYYYNENNIFYITTKGWSIELEPVEFFTILVETSSLLPKSNNFSEIANYISSERLRKECIEYDKCLADFIFN